MRIAVIGAGIVGVTTAYELAADGHRPTVFERRQSVAEEASFANAGLLSPAHAAPWLAPGMPRCLLKPLGGRHDAWRLHPGTDPGAWSWLWRYWRARAPARRDSQAQAMHALAAYSQQRLHAIRSLHRLEYEGSEGHLVLLRHERDVAHALPHVERLQQSGVPVRLLDPSQCREREPDLHSETPLAGGIETAGDEVGNCRQFAHLLREAAQRLGATFRFGTEVLSIEASPRPTLMLAPRPCAPLLAGTQQPILQQEREQFDAVVVCAAVPSLKLLEPLGVRLPLLPVYGYSLSAALRMPERGPRSAVSDGRYKAVISRHGQRVRVAGGAELGGHPQRHSQPILDMLYQVLHDWFPAAAQLQQAQLWKGARPMLPDGPPVIGPSATAGVWLNLGHGASGWTLACGSARLLADQLAQRRHEIDMSAFSFARFSKP